MALADPQSLTIGTAQTLPRTSSGINTASYTKDDQTTILTVSHTYGKRTRRVIRVTSNKITTDPMVTGQNVRVSASAQLTLDVPVSGFSTTEQKDILLSIGTWLAANTAANAIKVVGGEN